MFYTNLDLKHCIVDFFTRFTREKTPQKLHIFFSFEGFFLRVKLILERKSFNLMNEMEKVTIEFGKELIFKRVSYYQ